jgi:hypothetical protein
MYYDCSREGIEATFRFCTEFCVPYGGVKEFSYDNAIDPQMCNVTNLAQLTEITAPNQIRGPDTDDDIYYRNQSWSGCRCAANDPNVIESDGSLWSQIVPTMIFALGLFW